MKTFLCLHLAHFRTVCMIAAHFFSTFSLPVTLIMYVNTINIIVYISRNLEGKENNVGLAKDTSLQVGG